MLQEIHLKFAVLLPGVASAATTSAASPLRCARPRSNGGPHFGHPLSDAESGVVVSAKDSNVLIHDAMRLYI
jgi:hypothetical protein